jgi:serine/threonine protein kinase/formylglycine-generating enzyme required for sulfatase activity
VIIPVYDRLWYHFAPELLTGNSMLDDLRRITFEAFSHGWLTLDAVWELAQKQVFLKGPSPIAEILRGYLTEEHLSRLAPKELFSTPPPPSTGDPSERGPLQTQAADDVTHISLSEVNEDLSSIEDYVEYSTQRYLLQRELGVGGSGRVYSAEDRLTGRVVALKMLREGVDAGKSTKRRFLREAHLSAQLEHPGIIPVYDAGYLDDGRSFYSMRVVKQRSLREILRTPPPRPGFPLVKLCSIFVQICRAVAYAHARGVVHRDLKPDNILLGDYGEVYVADWGIAKVLGAEEPSSQVLDLSTVASTQQGAILGTPGYLSPEQAGSQNEVGPSSDLFSLGVILYEILTGRRPFEGSAIFEVMVNTIQKTPIKPRELNTQCPLLLDDLCMRLLSKDPKERPESAEVTASEVEAFLDGAKERERLRQEALRFVEKATQEASLTRHLEAKRKQDLSEAKRLLYAVKPFDQIEKKRVGWDLEDNANESAKERARRFAEAVKLYSQAIGYDPECDEARHGLAELYYDQFSKAEEERDEPNRVLYESLVEDYDYDGRYSMLLKASGRLSLTSSPEGALVLAYRISHEDRRRVIGEGETLGKTPLVDRPLPAGNYLLVLHRPGYREARYHLVLRRGESHSAHVGLYTEQELSTSLLPVPAGRFIFGGDSGAVTPLPREELILPDFAISRFPVTLGEYAEFLNSLYSKKPAEAERRIPREKNSSEQFLVLERGIFRPRADIVSGDGVQFCPPERISQIPVTAIDWFDALAYCRWRSERDGVAYRLPTEAEYEKAARGVDERHFPWGNHFDPLFCKTMDSRQGFCQMEPVGAFPFDESPYGVRDLAGSMRAWVADIYGELSWEEASREDEASAESQGSVRVVRGGSWIHPMPPCRAASRSRFLATARYSQVGLRLARALPKR